MIPDDTNINASNGVIGGYQSVSETETTRFSQHLSFEDNPNYRSLSSPITNQRTQWKQRLVSYWNNWKEIIVAVVFLVAYRRGRAMGLFSMMFNKRPMPYQQLNDGEYVRNLTNNEVYHGDTITDVMLLLLSFILPLTFQCILICFTTDMNLNIPKRTAIRSKIQATICTYLIALGITGFVTECVKNYVGYLRPVFYDLCQPNDDYTACTNSRTSNDAHKSFPSGHSSSSFCGLSLLTFFLNQHYGLPSITTLQIVPIKANSDAIANTNNNDFVAAAGQDGDEETAGVVTLPNERLNRDYGSFQVIKTYNNAHALYYRLISIVSLIPMGIALFVAASRVSDNKHFPADVVAGAIIGYSIASFIYGLWW